VALDSALSFRARGVLLFLLAEPDKTYTAADIAAAGLEGRDAIRTALEELAAAGYYNMARVRGADGRIRTGTQVSFTRGTFESTPIPAVVYFVERDGYIKIGTTTRLAYRLRQIRGGGSTPSWVVPGPVELLGTTPGGFEREHEIHAMFEHERVEGEWFQDCLAIRDFVAQLNQEVGVR
jgi:hypothetical protein